MISFERSIDVLFTVEQVYPVVKDIEHYPEFVPGCVEGTVDEESETVHIASLTFSAAGFKKGFTTKNTLSPNQSIRLDLVAGDVKTLQGEWSFAPTDWGTTVTLSMEFSLESSFMGRMIEKSLEVYMGKMVDAFKQRLEHVYG